MKIEISYVETADEEERLKRITEIMSDGVYGYLKKKGLLKESSKQEEKIKALLEKGRAISAQAEKI